MNIRKHILFSGLCIMLLTNTALAADLGIGSNLTTVATNASNLIYSNAKVAANVLQQRKLEYWEAYNETLQEYLNEISTTHSTVDVTKPHFGAAADFVNLDGFTFTEVWQAGDTNREKKFKIAMTIDTSKGGSAAAEAIKNYIPDAVVDGNKVTVEMLTPAQAYLSDEVLNTLVRSDGVNPTGLTTFLPDSTITFGDRSTINFGADTRLILGDNTYFDTLRTDGDLEVKDRILASDNNLIIGQMDGSGGVKNLTSLDIYSDATKFHGDVEADGDLKGKRLILTEETETYFRVGSDNIPEYSRNGSTYYDFITTENHKQDVDNVTLIITGGASGTATHTIQPDSSYSINITGLNASYLTSGTIPGARMSSNGSVYSHVTVGKAAYATQAQKANVAATLSGISSTSGNLATQAWVNNALNSAVPPGTIVAFAGSSPPSGWLFCNGAAFNTSTYPKLYAVLKSNYLPDLDDDVFIQGSTYYNRSIIQPGLPNITGRVGAIGEEGTNYTSGAFYQDGSGGTGDYDGWDYFVYMDASRCSSVYGRSNTVQPKAVRARYIIKY